MLLVFYRARYLLRCLREIYFPTLRQVKGNLDLDLSEKRNKRVLMIVHNDFFNAKGGVESYVLNLYNRIGKSKGGFDFYYLARVNNKNKKYGEIYKDKNKNNVFYINLSDGNIYSLVNQKLDNLFSEFIFKLQPDIVHFQHYIHFSLTWFRVIKKILPKTKIIVTLHEFLGICPNSGQMIKTKWQGFKLCDNSTVENCKNCFPYLPKDVFERRNINVRKYFKYIDLITAPSNFVLERYKSFGLKNKMLYSENGQEIFRTLPKIKSEKLRLLYLGQINKFKGLDVLLESMNKISNKEVKLSVYGKFQNDKNYNNKILKMVDKLQNVNFYGVYNGNQLPEIFSKHDVLVVPSIWWENSPMVIQESFMAKTPVLCSNIGGMKEKIIDGKNGWYFKVGDSNDLSEKINYFFENIGIFNNENFKVKNIKEDIKNLLKIYKDIV